MLDRDISKCAEYHNNRHVVKMILETVQLLNNALIANKMMKVFDCENMPRDIASIFRSIVDAERGCYIKWTIGRFKPDWRYEGGKNYTIVDNWLIENGADPIITDIYDGEEVLIKYD